MSGNLEAVSSDNLAERARTIGIDIVRLENLRNEVLRQGTHEANMARVGGIDKEIKDRIAEAAQIETILAARRDRSGPDRPDLLDPDDLDLGLNRNKAAEAAVKQAEAVKRLIENLQHERDQLGRTAEEQELYNALKSVGVELESEYGQAIAGVVSELQAKRKEIEGNAEAMKKLEDAAERALTTIADGFLESKDAGEIFGQVLRDIGRELMSMGIKGISSWATSLLPQFANGTRNAPGGLALVGERGPEIVNIPRGSQVIPSARSLAALGGGSGDGGFTFAPVIDARGADIAAVARLEQVVQRQQVEFEGRVKQIVRGRGTRWR